MKFRGERDYVNDNDANVYDDCGVNKTNYWLISMCMMIGWWWFEWWVDADDDDDWKKRNPILRMFLP